MNNDFIYKKKNGISKEKCNLIIDLFENEKEHIVGGIGFENKIIEEDKKCSEIFVDIGNKLYNHLFFNELQIALEEYKEKYPFIDSIYKWGYWPKYKIQRYFPNEGYFKLHCENFGVTFSENRSLSQHSSRMLVWMIYLNDVTDGGYTEFPTQEKLFQPRTGDIIIWPAYWTHPHRGIVSKTQTKYIMTGWWNHISSIESVK